MSEPQKAERMTQVAIAITHGDPKKWADLICPNCDTRNLVFSFTMKRPFKVKKPPRYGLFIVCKNCRQWAHFSLGEKPPNFREELVQEEFQRREDEAEKFARDCI